MSAFPSRSQSDGEIYSQRGLDQILGLSGPANSNSARDAVFWSLPQPSGGNAYFFASTPLGDHMADVSKEVLDLTIKTVEADAKTRFVELSSKIDRVIDALERNNKELKTVHEELKTVHSSVR